MCSCLFLSTAVRPSMSSGLTVCCHVSASSSWILRNGWVSKSLIAAGPPSGNSSLGTNSLSISLYKNKQCDN